MNIALNQILDLVGKLDDSLGDDVPRERFRRFLRENVLEVGQLRDYEEVIKTLVGKEGIYAFGERTPGRKHLKPGDWICFYAAGRGIVAHAKVVSAPEKKPHPRVRHPERYQWTFHLDNIALYLNEPVIVDTALRNHLDAFRGKDPNEYWSWFVQATRKITEHDFEILTRRQAES